MAGIIPADAGYVPGYKNVKAVRVIHDIVARSLSAEWTIASGSGTILSEIKVRANNINDIEDIYCGKMIDEAPGSRANAILCLKFNSSDDFDVIKGKVAGGLEVISEEKRSNEFR